MKNIKIKYNANNKTYLVLADTERFGKQEIMFEGLSKKECIRYIEKEGCIYLEEMVNHEDRRIREAFEKILKAVPQFVFNNLKISYAELPKNVLGLYHGDKTIELDAEESTVNTVIHEVGHYIHHEFFANRQFRFSTKYKSEYAYCNCYENFAECFVDYVNGFVTDRTIRMARILNL